MSTTLIKAITDSDTVLWIVDDPTFPITGGLLVIGTEQIGYDVDYQGTLYGCVRGLNSTSAAAHAAGAAVNLIEYYNPATAGASGTVSSGTKYQLGYYAANGTTISGLTAPTASRALATDANGLPTASATTATELGYVNGVSSAIQTQITNVVSTANAALPSASFTDAAVTGKVLTGYSSGAGTVAGTDTILQGINKLNGNDALKLPLAGGTLSGAVTFQKAPILPSVSASASGGTIAVDGRNLTTVLVTVDAVATISGPSNGYDGQKVTFRLAQDGSGHAVTFSTGAGNFAFGADITAFTASGASLTDYVGAIYNSGANRWHIVSAVKGY